MKCVNCGASMTTKREDVPFAALPGTMLVGVEVHRCASCGEYEVAIPALDVLMNDLANAVISKRGRLNGDEIRFLRKHLGYSSADFAKLIGSAAATISKWENDVQPIGGHADRLLRLMVAHDKKIVSYEIKDLAEKADEKASTKSSYKFTPTSSKKWKQAEHVAS